MRSTKFRVACIAYTSGRRHRCHAARDTPGADAHMRAVLLYSVVPAPSTVQVAFFLPQLVQQLREDRGGLVERFLLHAASRSVLFAHLLLCALKVRLLGPGVSTPRHRQASTG